MIHIGRNNLTPDALKRRREAKRSRLKLLLGNPTLTADQRISYRAQLKNLDAPRDYANEAPLPGALP